MVGIGRQTFIQPNLRARSGGLGRGQDKGNVEQQNGAEDLHFGVMLTVSGAGLWRERWAESRSC